MLRESFQELAQNLLIAIKTFYGERLVSVALFGSVARGTQRFDSDLDILIIADDLPRGRIRRIREFEAVEENVEPALESLREKGINTYLSVLIKSPEEVDRGSPILLDMVEDAVILFDGGGFFARRLERLKERLEELGARRVWKGDAWYWILKPDYQHGEIFEL